jgi:hypothetical protein
LKRLEMGGFRNRLDRICGRSGGRCARGAATWDNNERMPNTTITVDAELKQRLADLAGQTGQHVDEFVEALLRRIADADVRFERGVPVFPRRPGARTLTVEDVDRLADGTDK